MNSIVFSALLLVAAASAQSARGNVIATSRAAASASLAAAPGATPAAGSAAPTAAAARSAAAAPAAVPNVFASCKQCFGPGVNNPLALPPNSFLLQRAIEVASNLPNIRLFIDIDGSIFPTDQFGREVEVQDSFGQDPFDFEEQLEVQQQNLLLSQQRHQASLRQSQQLQQQRIHLEQQLSNIMRLLSINSAGAPGAAQPAAPAAAPVNRFTFQ